MCSFKKMFLLIATGHLLMLYKHVASFNPDFCVGLPDGNYINSMNCGTYYRCTADVALLLYCPLGRMFDPFADGCLIGAFCPFTCPVPLPVPFKALISHLPTPGPFDTAAYSCNSGYRLVGNPSLTCGPDGTWLGQEPTCVRVADGTPAPLPMLGTTTILGHRFGGTSIGLYGVFDSPALCAELCWATTGCVAANFFKIELQCELLSTKPLDYSLLDYTPANFDFVEVLN